MYGIYKITLLDALYTQCILCTLYWDLVIQIPIQKLYTVLYMDPEITALPRNLNTFTLAELKKEVIKMKHLNFAVTHMKRNQVIELIINYRFLFPHLMNKTGTKRRAKPKMINIPPGSIQLPPKIIQQLQQPVATPRTRKQPIPTPRTRPVSVPRTHKQQELSAEFLQQIF